MPNLTSYRYFTFRLTQYLLLVLTTSIMSLKGIIFICALIVAVKSTSVIVGQVFDHNNLVRKVHEIPVEATGIPFIKREQVLHYDYPIADQKIKGIAIRDLENGLAEPSITSGGLGFSFVDIKLRSERGSGYKYMIEIYA